MIDDILIHWGVKGMRWGVRKDRKPSKRQLKNEARYRAKGHSKSEATRLAKRRIRNQNIALTAGAITAAAATAYVVSDIALAKRKLNLDKSRTEQALKVFDKSDELMRRGEEFVRASFIKDDAWSNPVRTYAMRGSDDVIKKQARVYGDKLFSLETKDRSRIAGLQKQLDVLSSSDSKSIRDAALHDIMKKNPIGRRVMSRSSKVEDLSKATLSYINRTGYGAQSDISEKITKQYVDSLLERGYSAVRDTNHATSPAYVLLNRQMFNIGSDASRSVIREPAQAQRIASATQTLINQATRLAEQTPNIPVSSLPDVSELLANIYRKTN